MNRRLAYQLLLRRAPGVGPCDLGPGDAVLILFTVLKVKSKFESTM